MKKNLNGIKTLNGRKVMERAMRALSEKELQDVAGGNPGGTPNPTPTGLF
ncbi:MAG TPA: hypothetical protein VF469_37815 [Kofleriaceae bacterium]